MAKVTITLEDLFDGEDVAGCSAAIDFDPPLEHEGDDTLAQTLAQAMIFVAMTRGEILAFQGVSKDGEEVSVDTREPGRDT